MFSVFWLHSFIIYITSSGNYSNTQADTKTETKADTAYRLVIDNKDVIKQK